MQMLEARADAAEIAAAVAVRVRKGQRVDLVNHAVLPPAAGGTVGQEQLGFVAHEAMDGTARRPRSRAN